MISKMNITLVLGLKLLSGAKTVTVSAPQHRQIQGLPKKQRGDPSPRRQKGDLVLELCTDHPSNTVKICVFSGWCLDSRAANTGP